jgi:hypothetical protein
MIFGGPSCQSEGVGEMGCEHSVGAFLWDGMELTKRHWVAFLRVFWHKVICVDREVVRTGYSALHD